MATVGTDLGADDRDDYFLEFQGTMNPVLFAVDDTFLTLNLPMTTIVAQPFNVFNVIKWKMKFNQAA
jgi:hypothetical protein